MFIENPYQWGVSYDYALPLSDQELFKKDNRLFFKEQEFFLKCLALFLSLPGIRKLSFRGSVSPLHAHSYEKKA